MHKYKIISFDMDGTLTIGTTCLQYYLKKLNKENQAKEFENSYKNHFIDDIQIADEYAEILKGVSFEEFTKWTLEIPRLKNLKESIGKLKDLNFVVGITSVGPKFASEIFQKEFGFDFISGSDHEFKDGTHTGKMVNTLSGEDKIGIISEICNKNNSNLLQLIAVGDSRSDIPIFEIAGYSIALNADENLKNKANYFLHTSDALDIVKVIEKII